MLNRETTGEIDNYKGAEGARAWRHVSPAQPKPGSDTRQKIPTEVSRSLDALQLNARTSRQSPTPEIRVDYLDSILINHSNSLLNQWSFTGPKWRHSPRTNQATIRASLPGFLETRPNHRQKPPITHENMFTWWIEGSPVYDTLYDRWFLSQQLRLRCVIVDTNCRSS